MAWIKTKNFPNDPVTRGIAQFNAAVMAADRVDTVARVTKY